MSATPLPPPVKDSATTIFALESLTADIATARRNLDAILRDVVDSLPTVGEVAIRTLHLVREAEAALENAADELTKLPREQAVTL